jgi:hypothetical protein
MQDVRIRVIVTLASSAVLASGLSVAAAAVSPATSAAVTMASSSGGPTSNVTIIDP